MNVIEKREDRSGKEDYHHDDSLVHVLSPINTVTHPTLHSPDPITTKANWLETPPRL